MYNCRTVLGVGSVCGLGPDLVEFHSISLAARYRAAACSTTLTQGFRKSKRLVDTIALLSSLSLPSGRENFLFPPWLFALRTLLILFVVWTVMTHLMTHLMKLRSIKSRRLLLDYSVTNSISRTLLGLSPHGPLKFWDRTVDTELRTSCTT